MRSKEVKEGLSATELGLGSSLSTSREVSGMEFWLSECHYMTLVESFENVLSRRVLKMFCLGEF